MSESLRMKEEFIEVLRTSNIIDRYYGDFTEGEPAFGIVFNSNYLEMRASSILLESEPNFEFIVQFSETDIRFKSKNLVSIFRMKGLDVKKYIEDFHNTADPSYGDRYEGETVYYLEGYFINSLRFTVDFEYSISISDASKLMATNSNNLGKEILFLAEKILWQHDEFICKAIRGGRSPMEVLLSQLNNNEEASSEIEALREMLKKEK